jgi:hypothetical protein
LALQFGFAHPSITQAAKTVFEGLAPVVVLLVVSLPMIIPWARRVDTISTEEDSMYRDGITGSHFSIVGMDLMIIPSLSRLRRSLWRCSSYRLPLFDFGVI